MWTGRQCFEHARCALHLKILGQHLTVIELSLLICTCSCFVKLALPQMSVQCSVNHQTVSAHQQHMLSHMSNIACVSAEYTTTESQCIRVDSTKGMSALEGTSSSYRALTPGAFLQLVTRWVLMEF